MRYQTTWTGLGTKLIWSDLGGGKMGCVKIQLFTMYHCHYYMSLVNIVMLDVTSNRTVGMFAVQSCLFQMLRYSYLTLVHFVLYTHAG